MLLNYHIGRFVLGSLCVGDLVRLRLSTVRVAGWRWCHLLFYFTSYVLNMFRTLIYPSSAARDCAVEPSPHQISSTQSTENKTTNVVIQQHSCTLLMMDILIPETCWAHKKWNKIASDIKLVFYFSTNCLVIWKHGLQFFQTTVHVYITNVIVNNSSFI